MNNISRPQARMARIRRIRAKVSGTALPPRLAVFRSLNHISVQLINDELGTTLASVTDRALTGKSVARASEVGKLIAKVATEKNISTVVFDRAGYKYHGRVTAIADGAREAGLKL